MIKIILIIITLIFFFISFLTGCAPVPPPPATNGDLAFSGSPVLNKLLEVKYTFWLSNQYKWASFSKNGIVNVTANITLPNRFELIDGNLNWQGNLKEGEKAELKATIKAIKKGTCEITAKSTVTSNSGSFSGGLKNLYALILTDRGFVSEKQSDLPGEEFKNPSFAVSSTTTDEIVILPHLSIQYPPLLGDTAELTLSAIAMTDASNVSLSVGLPEEIEIVSGNLNWKGDMPKGYKVELKATIKPLKVGKWLIQTMCTYSPSPRAIKTLPGDYLYLYSYKDWADVVESPPITIIPRVNIDLSIPNPPPLNQTANVSCSVVALNGDLPKAQIQIYSNDIQIIGSDQYWEGEIKKGIPINLTVAIKPNFTGTQPLMAYVNVYDENIDMYRQITAKWLYLQVSENSATIVPAPSYAAPSPLLRK